MRFEIGNKENEEFNFTFIIYQQGDGLDPTHDYE